MALVHGFRQEKISAMIPTVALNRQCFSQLPDDVLRLIGMGQYTLYRVSVSEQPEIQYVLRTGQQEFFFLKEDGEPVSLNGSADFDIQEKVNLEDVPIFSVVPNLNWF